MPPFSDRYRPRAGGWRYQLEGAVFYQGNQPPDEKALLKALSDTRSAAIITDLTYGEDDGSMYASVSGGRPGGMPAFGTSLGRDRIWRVLAFVDSVRERPKGR